ncbi:GDSL-type esterase/lipase family protein [Corynebacterium sp.]|uniref:GDSL-type esterase/lipase family protein n=1 Tax=Corynebacterium sp. TaxID=1720 RepID=UPI003B3B3708
MSSRTPDRTPARTRLRAVGASLLTALGLGAALAPAAQADTGNVVTLGDSFTANPDLVRNTLNGVPGSVGDWAADYPQTAGCLQSPDNFPRKLAAVTGQHVDDYSCSGVTSGTMLHRVNQAISAGKVTDDSTVVMAVGMNDWGPFGAVADGVNILDPASVAANYRTNMSRAAERIRSVAPGATLVVSGALPTVDRQSSMFCAVNVVPDMPAGLPIPVLRDIENWNRDNQRTAADDIGATYVEVIDPARGHDTCAPDADRYVAGIIDTTTPNYTMMFHPSERGSQFLAETVAPHV